MEENKNIKRLESFIAYCKENPKQRFWQALRNWAFQEYKQEYADGSKPEIHFIFAGFDDEACTDTFFWD